MIDIACSAVISTGRLTPALVSIATVAGTMLGFAGSLVSALAVVVCFSCLKRFSDLLTATVAGC
jgi:hypothetical protein